MALVPLLSLAPSCHLSISREVNYGSKASEQLIRPVILEQNMTLCIVPYCYSTVTYYSSMWVFVIILTVASYSDYGSNAFMFINKIGNDFWGNNTPVWSDMVSLNTFLRHSILLRRLTWRNL
jgi:hypothetical protein